MDQDQKTKSPISNVATPALCLLCSAVVQYILWVSSYFLDWWILRFFNFKLQNFKLQNFKILTSSLKFVGLNRTGHLTRQDRTPKFAGQVLPDQTKSGVVFLKILQPSLIYCFSLDKICGHKFGVRSMYL